MKQLRVIILGAGNRGVRYTGYKAVDIQTSVKNHLIGFAAETARKSGTVEDVLNTIKQYGLE